MILSILLIIVCFLLILVVLMQNSKGGGISSQFSAANQIMGIRRGADFIEKATWTLAILLLVFSLLMTPKMGGGSDTTPTESVTRKKAQNAVLPQQAPVQQPQQAPGQPGVEQHGPNDGHNHE